MNAQPSTLSDILCPLDNQKNTAPGAIPTRPFNWAIIGAKGKGKTTVALNVLMKKESPLYRFFDLIFVISPTAKNDPKMLPLVEDVGGSQYYEALTNDVLLDIMKQCEEYCEKNKKKKKEPRFCVLYDDIIHQIKSKNANLVTKFATQNRHMKITNIYLLQKYKSFVPMIRSNLDCVTLFHNENEMEIESFCQELGNADKIRALYDFATAEPYSFLHINAYAQPTRYYKRFDEISWRKK